MGDGIDIRVIFLLSSACTMVVWMGVTTGIGPFFLPKAIVHAHLVKQSTIFASLIGLSIYLTDKLH